MPGTYHKHITGIDGETKSRSLTDVLGNDCDPTLVELADKMYSNILASKDSAKVVVESQPENIENINLIRSLFLRPIFLHAVRDPRDVFASWKHAASSWSTASVFANDPVTFSENWKRDQETAANIARADGAIYVRVRYEDLIDDAPSTLQELCERLGIVTNEREIELSIDQNRMSRIKGHANMPAGFFRKGVSQGWKNDLQRSEIAAIEFSLGDQLDVYGYRRSLPERNKLPLIIRARGLFRRALSNLRRSRIAQYLKSIG